MKTKLLIMASLMAGIGLTLGTVQITRASKASGKFCDNRGVQPQSHTIMIMDNKAEPDTLSGKLCDTVTIDNMDNVTREIAFGPHDEHVSYGGVSEKVLGLGQSFTITMNKTGNVYFHDHLHDEVDGHILVTK